MKLFCSAVLCSMAYCCVSCSSGYSDDKVWYFHEGLGDRTWADMKHDLSDWREVVSDSSIVNQISGALDSKYGWYVKDVKLNLSPGKIRKAGGVTFHLGPVSSADEFYVNGILVDSTGHFPPRYQTARKGERNYFVESGLLNLRGKNRVALRFYSHSDSNGGFIKDNVMSVSVASRQDRIRLGYHVADGDYIFRDGSPLEVSVNLTNGNAFPVGGTLTMSLYSDSKEFIVSDVYELHLLPERQVEKLFKHQAPEPGFYILRMSFLDEDGKETCASLNLGYEPEMIPRAPTMKPDFGQFWKETLAELSSIDPKYRLALVPERCNVDYDTYYVEMQSLGDLTVRGYYAQPLRPGKHPVIVEYMGYSSKPYFPNNNWDGYAYFVMSIRGQGLNEAVQPYEEKWTVSGIEDRKTYYYRGAYADVVRAIDFVCSREEIDQDRIVVKGASQGGGLSLAAAALDKRVDICCPRNPFLSDYPDYFNVGEWPRNDFEDYISRHPDISWEHVHDVLSYFDVMNLSQWVTCPVMMGIGVQDPTCPPRTNMADYNNLSSSEKVLRVFGECRHGVEPGYNAELSEWINKHMLY